ncbi:unnamed protein product [Ectocarpus sp. 12 AP-2014]
MALNLYTVAILLEKGREIKKSGGGGRNWGNDAAAGMDNAAANAENEAEGDQGAGWGANGSAAPNAEDPTTETGDGQATDGGESPKEDMPAPPMPEPEPEEIQLTLDEHQAMLDAKAKELADMIGEVSIKTVDNSEFNDGAIRNKQEVEEEGYLGGKVSKTRKVKTQQRAKEVFQDVGFRAPAMNSGGDGRGRGRGRGGGRGGRGGGRGGFDRGDRPQRSGYGGGEGGDRAGGAPGRGEGDESTPAEDGGPPRPRFQGGGGGRGGGFRGEGRGYQGGGGGNGGGAYRGDGRTSAPLNLKDDEAFPSL